PLADRIAAGSPINETDRTAVSPAAWTHLLDVGEVGKGRTAPFENERPQPVHHERPGAAGARDGVPRSLPLWWRGEGAGADRSTGRLARQRSRRAVGTSQSLVFR